jgi:hypothetical protein
MAATIGLPVTFSSMDTLKEMLGKIDFKKLAAAGSWRRRRRRQAKQGEGRRSQK